MGSSFTKGDKPPVEKIYHLRNNLQTEHLREPNSLKKKGI
jgi:hypothetical protein